VAALLSPAAKILLAASMPAHETHPKFPDACENVVYPVVQVYVIRLFKLSTEHILI